MNNDKQQIKKIVDDLLAAMDFSGEVIIDERDSEFLRLNVKTAEASFLIGRGGENLQALQQICRALAGKKCAEYPRFILDVNDYQKNRLDLLVQMALDLAKEVINNKQSKWLPPMNSYERRLVHTALAKEEGIKTESEGEGEERRVVIKAVSF